MVIRTAGRRRVPLAGPPYNTIQKTNSAQRVVSERAVDLPKAASTRTLQVIEIAEDLNC
jgi:hypothetical protein